MGMWMELEKEKKSNRANEWTHKTMESSLNENIKGYVV